ncbi:hypothetical protein [Nocardioides sp. R-C-SC26]|uniref:hypothetical protein n=1 Tax=Nocardioides sp. R-C-SC26 TaxID=2870414 RepID=UPI001E4D60B4|nr:hypothetical protein [Nocardioides sp. R-C-SC26]
MSEYQQERKGFWHEADGRGTSEAIALEAWARAAHPILEEAAQRYHAVVEDHVLAEQVQVESGIRTTRHFDKWLVKVLVPLAALHERDGYPLLAALVVDGNGWVGERHDDVLRALSRPIPGGVAVREQQAAHDRLACYQWAGSAPEDGGVAAPVALRAGGRARRAASGSTSAAGRAPRASREPRPAKPARVAATDRPVTICPRCFMALPATGVCDTCD